jgi:hypothetical protein
MALSADPDKLVFAAAENTEIRSEVSSGRWHRLELPECFNIMLDAFSLDYERVFLFISNFLSLCFVFLNFCGSYEQK